MGVTIDYRATYIYVVSIIYGVTNWPLCKVIHYCSQKYMYSLTLKKIPGGSCSQTPLDGCYVALAFEAWAPQFVKHSFPLVSRGVAPYLLCFSNELY